MIGVIVGSLGYMLGWYVYPESPPRAALVAVLAGAPVMTACFLTGFWF